MPDSRKQPVVLLVFANDRENTTQYLRNLAEEARQVEKALKGAAALCEVVVRQNVTAEQVFDLFQEYRHRVAVFHYGGHANGYQLLLESAEGKARAAGAAGLAAFLGQQRGLQLVFLNGCSTQPQVEALLEANVAAVIATAQAIDDGVATAFAARFYQGLAGGAPVGVAFREAAAEAQAGAGGTTRNLYAAAYSGGRPPAEDRWPWMLSLHPGAAGAADWNLPAAADDPLFGLPPLPPLDPPEAPYRHLLPFARAHARIFFGRGPQIRDLYHRIADPGTRPVVLLYGQSGVGKSSLLDAGVLPRLEATHEVSYLRRRQEQGLLGTLHLAFLPEVAGLTAAEAWRARERELDRPLVVLLDQVEEVYTRPNPQFPHELDDLLDAIRPLFSDANLRPRGQLILSFRKEWLPEIEKQLADRRIPKVGVFLERLDRAGVAEAVRLSRDVRAQFGLTIEPGLPERIADDLLEDPNSPVAPTLQVLLATMWEAARERARANPAFDTDLFEQLKRQGLHLGDFLDRQLAALRGALPGAVESGLALDVLAFHTTPLGAAGQRGERELLDTYSHQAGTVKELAQKCKELYLLADWREDQSRHEATTRLAHDTLAPLVRKRFDESDAPGQRARRILDNRAPEWADGDGAPLDGTDLGVVESGAAGTRRWDEAEQRLVGASRRQRDRRQRRLWLLRVGAGVAATVIAGLVIGLSFLNQNLTIASQHLTIASIKAQDEENQRKREEEERKRQEAAATAARRLNANRTISQYLEAGELEQGFAYLVRVLREDPDNAHARERLVSLLVHRRHPLRLWEAAVTAEPVTDFDLSPDGRTIAYRTKGGAAGLCTPAGQRRLEAGAEPVRLIRFAPDGKTVVGLAGDRVRGWAAEDGRVVLTSAALPDPKSFDTSDDSQLVAVGCGDGVVRFLPLAPGQAAPPDIRHGAPMLDVRLTSGKQVLIRDRNRVTFRDLMTGEPVGTAHDTPDDDDSPFAFARGGTWCHAVNTDSDGEPVHAEIAVHTPATAQDPRHGKRFPATAVRHLSFSEDAKVLVAAMTPDIALILYRNTPGEGVRTRELITVPEIKAAHMSRDGGQALCEDRHGNLRLFNTHSGRQLALPFRPPGSPGSFTVRTAGSRVAVTNGHAFWVWDSHEDGPVPLPAAGLGTDAGKPATKWTADGRALELRGQWGKWTLLEGKSGRELGRFPHPLSERDQARMEERSVGDEIPAVMAADVTGDGRHVVTIAGSDAPRVWSVETGETVHLLGKSTKSIHASSVWSASRVWAPKKGDRVVIEYHVGGRFDPRTPRSNFVDYRVFSVETGLPLTEMTALERGERMLDVSLDGRSLLVGKKDSVYVRELIDPTRRTDRLELGGVAACGRFSPNGEWFVVADVGGMARVVETATAIPTSEALLFDPARAVGDGPPSDDRYLLRLEQAPPQIDNAGRRILLTRPGAKKNTRVAADVGYELSADETRRLVDFALTLCGYREAANGRLEPGPTLSREELRRQFDKDLPPGRDFTKLMTWLLADPDKRPMTPLGTGSVGP